MFRSVQLGMQIFSDKSGDLLLIKENTCFWGKPKKLNINIITIKLHFKARIHSIYFVPRILIYVVSYFLLETEENTSCRVPSSSWAATDKTFSDNKPHSVFSFENNSSHFFIFALRRLIHTGDNIGPVFHFKLRPLSVCLCFIPRESHNTKIYA